MTKLTRSISITAFKDGDKPCCARDFNKGEVCTFYRSSHMGTREFCGVSYNNDGSFQELERRGKDGTGTLIPCRDCPVWNSRQVNDAVECKLPWTFVVSPQDTVPSRRRATVYAADSSMVCQTTGEHAHTTARVIVDAVNKQDQPSGAMLICQALNRLFRKCPMPERIAAHGEEAQGVWAEYWLAELKDGPDGQRITGIKWDAQNGEFAPA